MSLQSETISRDKDINADGKSGDRGPTAVAVLGGLVLAIAASSCCLLPVTLIVAGLGGAWIGTLTSLAPYQPWFIAFGAAFIATGFWLVYRPRAFCAADGVCSSPVTRRIARIGVWSATVIFAAALGFPILLRFLFA